MSCQYLFKSGNKRNTFCDKPVFAGSKYCKKHKTYMKAQETKRKNKKKTDTKKTDRKPISTDLIIIDEIDRKDKNSKSVEFENKKSSASIGVGTGSVFGDIISLLELTNKIKEHRRELEEEEPKEPEPLIKPIEIKFEVELKDLKSIDGLLKIIELYRKRPKPTKEDEADTINYDLEKLCRIEKELFELKDMIGLKKIKSKLCDMIVYLCQRNNLPKEMTKNEFLHTVLQGPPGCGKTTLANILAKIYKKLGLLSKGRVVVAKRADLIGKYCGHTAIKTQSKIDEARGGVLLIDEAYSLGNKNDDPDAFSRECIDTLNQNLSEREDFVCVIAGYKEHLERRFFGVNPGLSRRFPWVFEIDGYNGKELEEMFIRKVQEFGFKLEENAIEENFFKHNLNKFPFFGGSIHTFLNKVKICNFKRLFGKLEKINSINKEDIKKAMEIYKSTEMSTIIDNSPPMGMYL